MERTTQVTWQENVLAQIQDHMVKFVVQNKVVFLSCQFCNTVKWLLQHSTFPLGKKKTFLYLYCWLKGFLLKHAIYAHYNLQVYIIVS